MTALTAGSKPVRVRLPVYEGPHAVPARYCRSCSPTPLRGQYVRVYAEGRCQRCGCSQQFIYQIYTTTEGALR